MNDDLVKRLRADGSNYKMLEAADALEAKGREIKRLRGALFATVLFREFSDEWHDPANQDVVAFRELRAAALAPQEDQV